MAIVIDRIESKQIDRMRKTILFCGIALVSLFAVAFVSKSFTPDKAVLFALNLYLFRKLWVELKVRTGQFIEWTNDNVIYKLKTEHSSQTILISEIKDIYFGVQTFEIFTTTNEKHILDVSDFGNYKDRKRIRENFETLIAN